MTNEERKIAIERKNLLISKVVEEINKKCQESIDMIAVSGSFCNGLFYEKSGTPERAESL